MKKNAPKNTPVPNTNLILLPDGRFTLRLKNGQPARLATLDPRYPALPDSAPFIEVDDLNEIDFSCKCEFYMNFTQKVSQQAKDHKVPNRYQRLSDHDKLEAAMRSKETWVPALNGPVSFTNEGLRQNGENRFSAILRLDFPVPLKVTVGYSKAMNPHIDGGRGRTPVDQAEIGEHVGARYMGPMFNQLKRTTNSQKNNSKMDYLSIERMYRENPKLTAIMANLFDHPKGGWILRKSYVAAAIFLALPLDPENVQRFADSLASGEDLVAGNPAHTFRELVLKKPSNSTPTEIVQKGLRAILAYLNGKEIRRVVPYTTYSTFAKHFPVGSLVREWASRVVEQEDEEVEEKPTKASKKTRWTKPSNDGTSAQKPN